MPTEEKKPEIIVFAGPNGSGKSTITRLTLLPLVYGKIYRKYKK